MKTRPILAWAIANKHGRINAFEIFHTKPRLHRSDTEAGYRVIRVRIEPVEKKNP